MRPTLPESWKWCHLDDVATVQTGLALGKKDLTDAVERPYLRVANVQDGYFDLREIKTVRVERSKIAKHSLRYGDVLLTEGGDFDKLGRGHIWRDEVAECLHQNHVFAVRPDDSVLLPEYLAAITSGPWGRAYFLGCSKQSTNLASINSTQVKEMPLPLPPLDEQRQIVGRLAQFDDASTCLGELTEHRRRCLLGLMQQLLTGRRRLPAFAGEAWEPTRFGEFLSESREPGSGGDTARKLTVKLYGKGITPKRETKSGSDQTQYYRRSAGQFIYSKLDFLNGAFGIVPRDLDGFESTLDLPAFDVSPCADARWLLHFCTREAFYRKYAKFANGGRKARRVNPADFLKIEEPIPSLDEQRAIADILDTAQREIELLEQLREQIQLQKRGLMQKLLTGEIRVPAEATV